MKARTILGAIAGLALVIGGPTTVAFADDAPAPAPTPVVSSDTTAPDTTTAPAADATVPDATAPATDPAPADSTPTVVPAVSAALTVQTTVATEPPADPYVAVLWATDTYGNKYGQHIVQIVHEATETLIAIPDTCGTSYQSDVYLESAGLEALLDNGNGKLAGPDGAQDGDFLAPGGQGVAYNYVVNAVCPPPAEACAATGPAYTEDGFPDFTADGQDYKGGSGHAENWLVPTTGNLQGFTTASYTITTESGYHAAYRFVLYSNGTTGYTSVTAEPYMNGWTAGETGTFTITPATLVWNSHIASGPGSQGSPISITAMAALIPNNQFISQGIHNGSTQPAGQETVVSQITGCVTYNKPVKPESTYRQVTVNDCSTNVATTTYYETDYVWSDESHSYVAGDEYVTDTSTSDLTSDQIAEDCTTLPIAPPTSTDQCTGGTTVTPADEPEGLKYSLDADGNRPVAGTPIVVGAGQSYTITVHTLASLDNTFEQESQSWTYVGAAATHQSTDADAPCYVAPPTTPSNTLPKVLGFTGTSAATVAGWMTEGWIALALGFGGALLLTLYVTVIRPRRRAAENN